MNLAQKHLLFLLKRHQESTPDPNFELSAWTGAEWEDLIHEADRHALLPLLYHRISSRFPDLILSESAGKRMKREFRNSAARNLMLFETLTGILTGFSQAKIPVIVLKGAYLASAVYDHIALRSMQDLDLLVKPEDLKTSDSILKAAGFHCKERTLTPAREANEFHYKLPIKRIMVEVHWDLYKPDYPFRFDLEAMRLHAMPVVIAGVEARAFAPEDQLIHLASHTSIHRFEFGLRSLCDIAELTTRYPIDWPMLCEKARSQNMARAVAVPLILARELLGVKIPDTTVEELLPDGLPGPLLEEAKETVLLNLRGNRKQGEPNPNLLLFMGGKGWRNRLLLIRNRFFPSRETVASMHPVAVNSPLIWFYYFSHAWEILRRNLLGLKTVLHRRYRKGSAQESSAELMNWLLE